MFFWRMKKYAVLFKFEMSWNNIIMAHFQSKSKSNTVELLFSWFFFFVLKSFHVFSMKTYLNLGFFYEIESENTELALPYNLNHVDVEITPVR